MHTPVLLKEVLEYLDPQLGQNFIDATVDGGGHALAILERIAPEGKLLGIEWDKELYQNLKFKVENLKLEQNLILLNDSYANLKKICEENGFIGADGILFDLGLSSWHFEESGRGFSFKKDELLDMRFNSDQELSALEIVNLWPEAELEELLRKYGEERFSRQIVGGIVEKRKKGLIKTTAQLREVVEKAIPGWYRKRRINPATKTFQALRIAVNRELENLERGLEDALKVLKNGGRLAVISFHGLEDKIIKQKFNEAKRAGLTEILTKKTVKPGREEIISNPRSRSAKLRVIRKLNLRNTN